jgi:hypothetical protein
VIPASGSRIKYEQVLETERREGCSAELSDSAAGDKRLRRAADLQRKKLNEAAIAGNALPQCALRQKKIKI